MTITNDGNRPAWVDIFVKRPVLALVISMVLVLLGVRAAIDLPVLQFPKIESSSLVVRTPYVGASAEVVQGFITDPIERAAASVPGIDYIDSNTVAGFSTVTAYLELNEDSTDALAELNARLSQIKFELPAGAEDPFVEVVRADRPNAGFYLDVLLQEGQSRAEVTDYLNRRVNPILSSIPGVQRIGIEGGRSPAMRIWLDPDRMAMFDIGTNEVEAALLRNNIIATIGRTENETQRIDLLLDTTMQNTAEFERMVVRDNGTALVRIADIARVELGEVEGSVNARYDQDSALFISVWPLPGANEIAIADALYVELDKINETLPKGMHIGIGYDITEYMRSALREILTTLIETILLVGLVVIAFMGSFRSALVPLVTIPISILGAMAAMSFMGFSLNLLTVLAIVLSVGLVVDDAIVVVENVARYMRQGMSRIDAALHSSRQLVGPIIGMTVTLATVYAPIGLLSGLTGVLFKEFAFTLAVAVLISGLVALTLSPIMSAWVNHEHGHESRATLLVNSWFERLSQLYSHGLDWVLSNVPKVLAFGLYASLLILPFFFLSQRELAPTEDQSGISVVIDAPPESSLEYTTHHIHDVVDVMNALPGTTKMWQIVLPSGGFGGQNFVDASEREHSVHDLMPQVYGQLSQVSGVKAFPILPPALPTAGNFAVELVVMSSDTAEDMQVFADRLVAAAMGSGKFMFASSDLRIDMPQGRFRIDRQKVADLGMDLAEVSRQLSLFTSSNYLNRFNYDGKAYQVIPMIENSGRADPEAVLDLKIRTPNGDLVPFSSLAELDKTTAPRVLSKFQQKNAFRVFGGVIPGTTKEQGLQFLEQTAAEILPPGYSIDYAGESRQLRQEGNTMFGVLGIAIAFVFFVLAIQFNSFRDPLVVLIGSVPLALSGAMLFTYLGWTSINIYSQVGFITLVGLIAKNAILIVEFANQLQLTGIAKYQAIREACLTRLRPVLMTTGATVLGHFPLVLVDGAGAAARNSIGIILVAGMLVGTLFTLFVLPCVYMALASDHNREELEALDAEAVKA